MKRLAKSQDKKVAGVLSGIAEYTGVDPTLVRVGFVFLLIFTGIIPCLIFYFAASLLMPESGHVMGVPKYTEQSGEEEPTSESPASSQGSLEHVATEVIDSDK